MQEVPQPVRHLAMTPWGLSHPRYRSLAAGLVVIAFFLVASGCGGSGAPVATDDAAGQLCDPGPSESAGIADVAEGRRGEALVKYLTGYDELERDPSLEGVEVIFDDPNFGGVWGDFEGGWVVAVIHCDQVDVDQIARIAGGANAVRIIQVPYTFEEVNDISDRLGAELRSAGIPADLPIDSTLTGRHITVIVEDLGQLDAGFGSDIPAGVWSVREGELSKPVSG